MFRHIVVDGSQQSRKLLVCKDGAKSDRGVLEMINFREDRRRSLKTCPLSWNEQREKSILVMVK